MIVAVFLFGEDYYITDSGSSYYCSTKPDPTEGTETRINLRFSRPNQAPPNPTRQRVLKQSAARVSMLAIWLHQTRPDRGY